jgi:hypothetical protein
VDTSAGGRLVPEDTIHPIVSIVILTTGGWYPLGLNVHQQSYPPSDSNTDYWWMVSFGTNIPPGDDTSAGGLLVPEDTIHPVVSITITRWIPLLVEY